MNAFEQAQIRLELWITSDPARHHDFLKLSKGLGVQEYCSKYSYIQDIIRNIVMDMQICEVDRIVDRFYGYQVIGVNKQKQITNDKSGQDSTT